MTNWQKLIYAFMSLLLAQSVYAYNTVPNTGNVYKPTRDPMDYALHQSFSITTKPIQIHVYNNIGKLKGSNKKAIIHITHFVQSYENQMHKKNYPDRNYKVSKKLFQSREFHPLYLRIEQNIRLGFGETTSFQSQTLPPAAEVDQSRMLWSITIDMGNFRRYLGHIRIPVLPNSFVKLYLTDVGVSMHSGDGYHDYQRWSIRRHTASAHSLIMQSIAYPEKMDHGALRPNHHRG